MRVPDSRRSFRVSENATLVKFESVQELSLQTNRAAALSCEVFRDFGALVGLREEWDVAALQAGGNIYMTYDWARLWWEFYGKGADLRVFVFSLSDRIVAIVPIYIDSIGWGMLRFRVARLVGANIPPKVFRPPVPSRHATEVFGQVIERLFIDDRCDALSFGPVSELDESNQGLLTSCQRRTDLVRAESAAEGVHSIYYLPGNMDEYFCSTLRKSERKNRRKLELRLLKKEHDTRVETLSHPDFAIEAFEQFAEQHRRQWRTEGRSGHFGAWPHALDFHRSLVRIQAEHGRLRFIRIVADSQVVASEYAFAFGNRYYAELTSRATEPRWERFSLGPTSTVTMLSQAISEGMQQVESGLGHYDYKVRLGVKEHAALRFRIVAVRFTSRARFGLFGFARECMKIVYHKLWYRRVMPRLPPALWRPQCRLWLRLDF